MSNIRRSTTPPLPAKTEPNGQSIYLYPRKSFTSWDDRVMGILDSCIRFLAVTGLLWLGVSVISNWASDKKLV